MNRISLLRLRLTLQHRLAVKASPLGGWLVEKPFINYSKFKGEA